MPRHPAALSQPVDYLEAAGMAYCAEQIALLRGDAFDSDPFNTDTMHRLLRETFKALAAVHERNAARIVKLALAGALDADQALRDLIAERHGRGEPLGSASLHFYSTVLADQDTAPIERWPKSRPRDQFLQNFVIVCLLIALMRQFPALKFRRRSDRHPSACSILAAALIKAGIGRGGEEAIRKIWERYGPPTVPGYRWTRK